MRREERFMNILGGLDEKYVALAMPSSCGHSTIGDTGNVVYAQPSEDNTEVSKKDLRIYWITRALGMAAALALVVGGGVWLWKNWDKIAVSGNNRPGEVTSITEAPVVTSSITTSDISVSDSTDIFGQITDSSMPLPFEHYDSRINNVFFDLWDSKFTALNYNLAELDSKYDDKLMPGYWLHRCDTPYKLDDDLNIYSWMTDLGIPAYEVCSAIEKNNEYYRTREDFSDIIYTDEEIAAIRSGDRKKIAETFASEYCIVVGENVFSPRWLYYHTTEDYKAVGIDPYAMHSLLEKYADLGLAEEAWRAFRKKLILYAYSEMYPEKDRTYTYELDVSEPLGDEAFRIFENVFYGQWEYAGNIDGHFETFNMTYNGSSFRFGRILGIFETDEIYVIHYSSSGGTLECYVIEKSSPDIMYETDVLTSLGGIEEIKLGDNERVKYINRGTATAELKPGELSIPGLTYLFHIYGSDFEDYYRAIIDRNGYQSISEDEGLYLGNGYVLDSFIQYLVDMSANSVTFALPYVHDKQESHQTAVYYELTFTKDESGEWSVSYAKSETYTSGYSFNGVEIPDELITEDGEGYIRAASVVVVAPTDGALSIVKRGDELDGLIVEECSSTFFKHEDNTLEYGDCRARLSGEIEVSGFLRIDWQNIDETYGRNGGIEFIPADADFPMFYSDHHNEKMTGNSLFIGSIFDSSEYYIGDEYAEKLTNYSDKRVTVKLKDISISMAVNEADSSKAILTAIEGL